MTTGSEKVSFSVEYHPAVVVIRLGGEVDLGTAPMLGQLLRAALGGDHEHAGRDGQDVIIDLGAVGSMDAAGLRLVLQIEATGGAVFVRAAPPAVQTLLDAAGASFEAAEPLDDEAILESVEAATKSMTANELLAAALAAVAASAATLPNIAASSITVLGDEKPVTLAASHTWSRDLDQVQYDTGGGPCLEAASTAVAVRIGTVSADPRWPDFIAAATAGGVRSVLSVPIVRAGGPAGAVNLYSLTGGLPAEATVAGVTDAAGAVLASAQAATAAPERIRGAMETRRTIALAQGALMAQESLSDARAYWVLGDRAREHGTSLADEAVAVLRAVTGEQGPSQIGLSGG